MPPDRRFCRCGASLVTTRSPAPTATTIRRPPWYRSLGELLGTGRDFRRAMRAANGGLRVTYDVGLAARARLVRLLLLLGALGFGVAQLGPWGGELRARVAERIDQVLPHQYRAVPVDTVTTDPAARELPDFAASYVVDGDPQRAWAQRWTPVAAGGARCRDAGGAPALMIGFRREARVEQIVVRAGLADDNDGRLLQFRPRTLHVLFSDGTCHVEELADTAEPQELRVDARAVTHARVVIVDAYPPADAGDGLVGFSEITFNERR